MTSSITAQADCTKELVRAGNGAPRTAAASSRRSPTSSSFGGRATTFVRRQL